MSNNLAPELRRDIDRLCDLFEDAWRSGARPAIPDYVRQAPDEAKPALLQELQRVDAEFRQSANSQDMKVALSVVAGPDEGKTYEFTGHDTFLVGRSLDVHFPLPNDPYFSRFHFLIEVNPPLCRLTDLRSHNGTKVNGARTDVADLKDGDEVAGGETRLRVRVEQPTAAATLTLDENRTKTHQPEHDGAPSIPGYRLVEKLGQGGMGVVYRAIREDDGNEVALKTIRSALRRPQEDAARRFIREAKILQSLQHPHIVGFRDLGQVGELFYIAMDYVRGADAGKLLKQHGPLDIGRAVRLTCDMLEALAYAHGQGIVHRDIKPANLLVTQENNREAAKVSDFGLARVWQQSPLSGLTVSGHVAGTPDYMPPEQVLNFKSVQPAGDQYAAAATLYTLLTAQPIFERRDKLQEKFKQILQEKPTPIRERRPDVLDRLAEIIHRGLAKKPDERFADAAAMRGELRAIAEYIVG